MTRTKRSQTKSGGLRKKRSDTRMGNLEKTYGKDFGVRSDMKLGNFLKKAGYPTLSKFFQNA